MLLLIVDDAKEIRQLYAMELEIEGYEVITSPDGRNLFDVIDVIEKLKPCCVILDIKMRYSGLDLLQEIKRRWCNLPVILNSAYASFKSDIKALEADAYVVKSSDMRELKREVKRLCPREQGLGLSTQKISCSGSIKIYLNCYETGSFKNSSVADLTNDFTSFCRARLSGDQLPGEIDNLTPGDLEILYGELYRRYSDEKDEIRNILDTHVIALEALRLDPYDSESWSKLDEKFSLGGFQVILYDTFSHLVKEAVRQMEEK